MTTIDTIANSSSAETPHSLSSRAMRLADIDAIFQMESACFPISPWKRKSSFNSHIKQRDGKYGQVICTAPGVAVGYYLAAKTPQHLSLLKMAVHPSYRRMGIGKFILSKLVDDGRLHPSKVVELHVRASNEQAIRLYSGAGYREVERIQDYYSRSGSNVEEKTALKMRLALRINS